MVLKESESNLEIGEVAPKFNLKDHKGENVRLEDLNNYDGVLVVFICNHCPYVKSQVEELKTLDEEFSSLAIVGINPNVETHPEDSLDKMSDFVEENDLDFHYLADPTQEVAKSYGAQCTPDPFLLDWRHRLYYKGRLNDSLSPEQEVNDREMRKKVQDMLKRREPSNDSKPSQGCSIKWKDSGK